MTKQPAKPATAARNAPATAARNAPATAAPATAAPATAAPVPTGAKPRIAPELTGVSNKVAMPAQPITRRGSKSPYPFDALRAVGMSFGIKNKTAKNMASIVSNQNRKCMVHETDGNGVPLFVTQELTDASGNVTIVPTEKPLMKATKRFFASDCDPKTDPDGASVRVFRES